MPKDPKWKIYERVAAELEGKYENCQVIHDHKVLGRRSGMERQVDVWLTGSVGRHEINVAVECRCYRGKVGIKDIDAFYGFLDDVGANKGVLISDSGFTGGASKRAHKSDMELITLTLQEAEEFDWNSVWEDEWQREHRRFYTCKTGFCHGSIHYEKDTVYGQAGHCQNCGQFHIWCNRCNTVNPYDLSTSQKHEFHHVRCVRKSGRGRCRMEWQLYFERGILESMKQG